MQAPSFCDTCAAVFRSQSPVEGESFDALAGRTTGACPVCGGTGHIADDAVDFVGRAIAMLFVEDISESELARVGAILTEACGKRLSVDEIVAKIGNEAPAAARVSELLAGFSSNLYSFVTLTVGVISLVLKRRRDGDDAGITVEQTIDHVIDGTGGVAASLGPIFERGIRRNDRCLCGSGKKYKHCCGALP